METRARRTHSRELLLRRRCGSCAERVPASAVLRGESCPSCGRELEWPVEAGADTITESLDRRWRRRRVVFYAVVGVATGLTGFVPLLPALLSICFMIYVRLAVLKEPLRWLSPARRALTRFGLKAWLVVAGTLSLALGSAAALVPFANVPVSGLVGLAANALFVETSLPYLRNRLRREADCGPGLESWEIALPAGLVVGMTAAVVGAVVAGQMVWRALASMVS